MLNGTVHLQALCEINLRANIYENSVIPNEPSNHNLGKKRLQKCHRTFSRHRLTKWNPNTNSPTSEQQVQKG